MEKLELVELIKQKLVDKGYTIIAREGEMAFKITGVTLPSCNHEVSVKFDVGGSDFLHLVKFDIMCPMSVKGNYNSFYKTVNTINKSLSTGRYYLDGESEDSNFCSSYQTTYFNTDFEEMNVNRTLMFMLDSLLLEFSNILKRI